MFFCTESDFCQRSPPKDPGELLLAGFALSRLCADQEPRKGQEDADDVNPDHGEPKVIFIQLNHLVLPRSIVVKER